MHEDNEPKGTKETLGIRGAGEKGTGNANVVKELWEAGNAESLLYRHRISIWEDEKF